MDNFLVFLAMPDNIAHEPIDESQENTQSSNTDDGDDAGDNTESEPQPIPIVHLSHRGSTGRWVPTSPVQNTTGKFFCVAKIQTYLASFKIIFKS